MFEWREKNKFVIVLSQNKYKLLESVLDDFEEYVEIINIIKEKNKKKKKISTYEVEHYEYKQIDELINAVFDECIFATENDQKEILSGLNGHKETNGYDSFEELKDLIEKNFKNEN